MLLNAGRGRRRRGIVGQLQDFADQRVLADDGKGGVSGGRGELSVAFVASLAEVVGAALGVAGSGEGLGQQKIEETAVSQ